MKSISSQTKKFSNQFGSVLTILALLAVPAVVSVGCGEEKNSAEEAFEEMQDEFEDAGDEIKDEIDDHS